MKSSMKFWRTLLKCAVALALALGLCTAAAAQETKVTKQQAAKKVVDAADEGEASIAKTEVPAAVLAAFAKAFPKAIVKGYSKEIKDGKPVYEVESMEGATHRDVSYAADGKVLTVEESMEMKDVPAAVRAALEKKFPNAKVDLAEKIMEGSTVAYEFHLTTAQGKEAEVKFDATGKEVKS